MAGRQPTPGARPQAVSPAVRIRIERDTEIPGALEEAGVGMPRPTILLVGGAGRLATDDEERIGAFFGRAVVPFVERIGGAIVDGGTHAGVMRLIGRARSEATASFPLVGVAAAGTVSPMVKGGAALEHRHSAVLLVPGEAWGDESAWLQRTAAVLAGERSPVTLVVNGGPITLDEAVRSAGLGYPVVTVAGSGRSADVLAAAARGSVDDPRAAGVARTRRLHVVEIGADSAGLASVLEPLLLEGGSA